MIAYERNSFEVRTSLGWRLELCKFKQFYCTFVVTLFHGHVSEQKEHLRLGRTSATHPRDPSALGTCLNSVEDRLVIHCINEVMDARHRIISLLGLKQND